jgi:hypothetical protein
VLRRVVVGLAAVVIVVGLLAAALLYWFVSGDGVRHALEAQASRWLGQPVTIGTASATVFPRVGVRLRDVRVGMPARVALERVDLSTGLRPLLSRRIEDADVIVGGGRIQMPLPFGLPSASRAQPADAAAAPVAAMELVSIRTISLDDVVLESRGRAITVEATSSMQGNRLTLTRLAVAADGTELAARGTIDLSPRVSASITATANQLDFDDLLALAAAFTPDATARAEANAAPPAEISASITAPRAALAGVPVSRFEASLLADGTDLRIEPLKFDIFGGRYDGWLDAAFGDTLAVRVGAGVSNIDVAQLAAFGNAAGTITGRLYGSGRFGANGATLAEALDAVRGVGEVSINNGSVQGLQLLRTVLDFLGDRDTTNRAGGEPFASLGGTFALADDVVRSDDLAFRATDFDVFARGTFGLAAKTIDARADLVLSEALSARAPRGVYQYARSGSRLILPAIVGGTLAEPRVRIDAAAVIRRGLRNEVERRFQDLLERVAPKF